MSWRVDVGDCVPLMAAMPACSVDAVVCDPPYGLEFMGKEWDKFAPDKPKLRSGWEGPADTTSWGDTTREGWYATKDGAAPPAFHKRRSTYSCTACGKRDAFRNPHDCEGTWEHEWTDAKPLEALGFQAWCQVWATEALRVLKPGGHLLAFGGTRTSHRLACAIEDAGFEIRDTICWLYGSGFPKSLDVGKAIDKQAGAAREVLPGPVVYGDGHVQRNQTRRNQSGRYNLSMRDGVDPDPQLTAPATSDAERWDGWGTALKPAHEPIVVARKPLAGTVAANVLEHGTGGLNVDGCRVGTEGGGGNGLGSHFDRLGDTDPLVKHGENQGGTLGRWPANVVLDEQAATMLDRQSGDTKGAVSNGRRGVQGIFEDGIGTAAQTPSYADSGGASRFFYTAKASRAERNAGLDGFEAEVVHDGRHTPISNPYLRAETKRRNTHPTVKPVSLMRWLCRLVTPPDGLILDPFAGSGTTGIAAVLEGFNFAGCEQDAAYADIAKARIGWWELHGHDALRIVAEQEAAENEREAVRQSGQMELL